MQKRDVPRRSPIFSRSFSASRYMRASGRAISELITYMSLIIRVSREYAGMVWWNYNVLFRKHAALKQDTKWSVINTTMHARCFTGTPKNSVKCKTCLATTHDRRDCDQWMFPEPAFESRTESMEKRMRQFPLPSRSPIRYSGKVCQK